VTDHHRIAVAVQYRANVVPKGARLPRVCTFRAFVPVDIEVVADPDLAVVCRSRLDRTSTYHGHAGTLWHAVPSGWHEGSAPLQAEEALRRMSAGLGFDDAGGVANPFLELRPGQVHTAEFRMCRTIEETAIRSFHGDDLAEVSAAARRLAAEMILTTDGRIMRRSPGPFWGCHVAGRLEPMAVSFGLPLAKPDHFACTRLAEAKEFQKGERPGFVSVQGEIEILAPECVPDRDAEVAARAVCQRGFAPWFAHVGPLASPSVAELAERAAAGFERIHGMPREILAAEASRQWPTPAGSIPPTPAEIADAVESLRLFASEMPGPIDDPEVEAVCANWRSVFRDLAGRALRRYDDYERDRLPDPEGVPELDPAPSPAL
jgi:hypothetical protein